MTVSDRRSLVNVNVVCVIVLACVGRKRGKRGAVGVGKELESGAVDSEQGASEGRSSQLCTKCYHSK
jgi:hypothetical protein